MPRYYRPNNNLCIFKQRNRIMQTDAPRMERAASCEYNVAAIRGKFCNLIARATEILLAY